MASKKQKAREYLATTHGDDRGGFALKAAADYGRAKEKFAPAKSSPSTKSTTKTKRSGNAPTSKMRRPEKDDIATTPERPAAFSTGPSSRGGARRVKTSTGPSTRGGARKSSVGTAGGGSSSRAGKRPEGGLISKIRKTLSDGASGGFMKKYRKK